MLETHTSGVFSFANFDVNNSLQVLKAEKKPITNIYAAAEVIAAWQCVGDVAVNGCMVTPAITFGRMLGDKLLAS
jgi:fumarate reductase flavoprotein subunit